MLCSSMKLSDRGASGRRDDADGQKKRHALETKMFMKSDYCHSYSFRWDKPKRTYTCDDAPYLSIKNIIPPNDINTFNTGSSTERWSKKRPRLKAAKPIDDSLTCSKLELTPKFNSDSEDNFDVSNLLQQLSEETDVELPDEPQSIRRDDDESDVDSDIKRLLSFSQNATEERDPTRRKQRRRGRRDKAKKKTKTIKFSLSKPPTPQTLQVIRVDVTSNYSYETTDALETEPSEEKNVSDCSRGCGRRIRSCKVGKSKRDSSELESGLQDREMNLLCRKVVLTHRKLHSCRRRN